MSTEPLGRGVPEAHRGYYRGRVSELALPATRAVSEPLADWALRRVRLDNRPFRFEGQAYLRAIYDDTAPHIVLSKAAQIGGTTWAILAEWGEPEDQTVASEDGLSGPTLADGEQLGDFWGLADAG